MNPENYKPDRQIVPLEHRPTLEQIENIGFKGILLKETDNVVIHCENPVEVEP